MPSEHVEARRDSGDSLIIADSEATALKTAQRFGLTDLINVDRLGFVTEEWLHKFSEQPAANYYSILSKVELDLMFPPGSGNPPGVRMLDSILRGRGWPSATVFVLGEVLFALGDQLCLIRTSNSGQGLFAPLANNGRGWMSDEELFALIQRRLK